MKKEAGLVLGVGLLGLVFFRMCTGAEAASIETTAPEIVGEKPAGAVKEELLDSDNELVRDRASALVLGLAGRPMSAQHTARDVSGMAPGDSRKTAGGV